MNRPTNSGFMVQMSYGRNEDYALVIPSTYGRFGGLHRINDGMRPPSWLALGRTESLASYETNPVVYGISLIRSTVLSTVGNLAFVAHIRYDSPDRTEAHALISLWRTNDPTWYWMKPTMFIQDRNHVPYGSPAFIQSSFGGMQNNYEVVVPLRSGGIAHYWLINDGTAPLNPSTGHPDWGLKVIHPETLFRAVALIQRESYEDSPGALEVIAIETVPGTDRDAQFWHLSGWHPPSPILGLSEEPVWKVISRFPGPDGLGRGTAYGIPAFIRFKEDVDSRTYSSWLITPLRGGGMAELRTDPSNPKGRSWGAWRLLAYSNGEPLLPRDRVSAISLIQSNLRSHDYPTKTIYELAAVFFNDDHGAFDVMHSTYSWGYVAPRPGASLPEGFQWSGIRLAGIV